MVVIAIALASAITTTIGRVGVIAPPFEGFGPMSLSHRADPAVAFLCSAPEHD